MKIDIQIIAALCRQYGTLLKVPVCINGPGLLWALAGNESSFGASCAPRHELGYCYGHKYFDASYTHEWGCLAHCSFSPWQIMATNAKGFSPLELLTDPEKAVQATVGFLNRQILGAEKAVTLSEIADAYNSGNWRDANVPQEYIDKLLKNFGIAMPAPLAAGASA
ncbi:MAG TPA: hypothetical protein VGP89_09410 [Candidatus Angelobacter sp.]|jgi:hypothetical protein|nr:hypothetical protein [Candidatus Angelobacter sp.]